MCSASFKSESYDEPLLHGIWVCVCTFFWGVGGLRLKVVCLVELVGKGGVEGRGGGGMGIAVFCDTDRFGFRSANACFQNQRCQHFGWRYTAVCDKKSDTPQTLRNGNKP